MNSGLNVKFHNLYAGISVSKLVAMPQGIVCNLEEWQDLVVVQRAWAQFCQNFEVNSMVPEYATQQNHWAAALLALSGLA